MASNEWQVASGTWQVAVVSGTRTPKALPLATCHWPLGRLCCQKTAILSFLFAVAGSTALAQTESTPADRNQSGEAQNEKAEKEEKRGEFLVAPIPIASPTIGTGLEWALGYVFPFSRQDKISPHSVAGVGGLFTDNGSRGIAGGGRLYFKQDKYRFTVAGGNAKINADFTGIGNEAGDRGLFLPLTTTGSAFITESLVRVRKSLYLGARFQYRDLELRLNQEESTTAEPPPPPLNEVIDEIAPYLLRQRTVAVGPRLQWDTRDTPYYPHRGVFLETGIDLFTEALGSKFTYQYYKFALNKYTSLGDRQVLAVRGMGCAAAGDRVPLYDLCLFGTSGDLRGYAGGRYQDRRMFATQAEYRLTMPPKKVLGRFGVVAFGGFGGVAEEFSEIAWKELLPAGGAGIRFRLTKEDHINFRIDYAIGTVGHTLSMGVGEAF
ncbi:MAG: hypothetical protein EHM61_25225 [Acidobacteria bacterium]|nr:MAG: hypothetical protein EHM61_25225 [Acidobacteriota bacterium]